MNLAASDPLKEDGLLILQEMLTGLGSQPVAEGDSVKALDASRRTTFGGLALSSLKSGGSPLLYE